MSNPTAGTYAYVCSCAGGGAADSNPYPNGQRVTSTNSGSTWTADTTAGGRDLGFTIFMKTGFPPSGAFVSSVKDANPAPGSTSNWGTLSWVATTPANTNIQFQIAASNSAAGPFNFVGPNGTAGTFFTNGASLTQFNNFRYLKYQATLTTTDSTVTPSLDSVSVCFTDISGKTDTTTTLASSPNPSAFGQSVTFTATITPVSGPGTPTGTVTFLDGGSPIGTGTLSGGIATFTTSALAVGNHTITTNYGGDGNFNGSTGSLTGNPQVVNKANTATTLTSSVNPSVSGQSVTFTATLLAVAPGAGTPVGTVTFLDGGSPIGTGTLSGGIATFTTSALGAGNHTITTNYGGDGNFNGSTGSLTGNPQVVNKANTTTTVTSSANPSVFGQSVTFTATASAVAPGAGTPTGTVTFLDGGSPIGTGTLSGGIATFTTSALAIVSHTITTSYGGDGNFNGSTGSLTGNPQVVNKANTATTVTSSVNPSAFGQSVTFTATLSAVAPGTGTPTGTVTFLDGGSPIGSGTLSGGIATFTTSALAVGNHTITTNYGGDGNFNGSAGSLTGNPQVVNKANSATTVTSSANPSVLGQSVTFTATVSAVAPSSGTPGGTVTFLDGGSPIGTGTLSGGIATFTTSALAVGNHTITTSYGGDSNFNGSTGSLTGNPQVVNKSNTATTVTSSLNPSVFGQSVTFTATVSPVGPGSGTATGTVTFLDGGSPIGTGTLSGGVATFATSALAIGNHTITTNYGGDGNFNGSIGSLTGNPQVVNRANTTTTVTSSANPSFFGQSVTFTATVATVAPGSGTPTGTVTFLDGGSPIGTGTLSGGIGTFTTSALALGNHTITTNYGGDGNFNGSTGSLPGNPQVVNRPSTTVTVTSSLNPSIFGQSVTFTAAVSPIPPGAATPTGTVTFQDGGVANSIGTAPLIGGIATFTTSALFVGPHTITTSYSGDAIFFGNTGSLSGNPQVVNQANTATTVSSSQNPQAAGQPVTFTATVSAVAPGGGTPSGTVTFLDGGTPIVSGTLSGGIVTFTTSALTVGNHTITTNYGGDGGGFIGSTGSLTGNPQVITSITGTATTLAASQGTITLGDSVTFTATVTATAGTATGVVVFFDGSTLLGSGTLNQGTPNQATFTTSLLSVSASPHSITANYQGDTAHDPSASSASSVTVNKRASTTSPFVLNPSTVAVDQPSTATVTVTDSGSVPPGTADTFTTTHAPSVSRAGATATLLADGRVLVAGGFGADATILNTVEVWNGSGFSQPPIQMSRRYGHVAVLLPNLQVLVAGGFGQLGPVNTAELFDPISMTFSSGSSDVMEVARYRPVAALLNNGRVLVAGGMDTTSTVTASAELYDPVFNRFIPTGSMNTPRFGATATMLGNGKVLIVGGSNDGTANGAPNGALNTAELYDPAGNNGAGTFTLITGPNSTLSALRWQPEAALLQSGKVLIAGGGNSGGVLASADLYDPVTNTFTPSTHSMSQAREGGSAVALPNGMVLLAGGTPSQAVDLYDAESDQFVTTGSLQQSDAGPPLIGPDFAPALVSALLNNGDVLVVGITSAATPASDAELYTPSFNPLGTVSVTSSEATDSITGACVLTPSTSTASTCTTTVTPANIATSPHTITGTYPADAVHSGSNNTASLTVNKADTTTTVTSSANPSVFGQSVTFTATVSPTTPGAATGTVTFLDGGSPIGTGTLSGGVATFTTSALAVGNHTITTTYGGDVNFNGSTGSLTGNPQVVNKADTSTTVISSVNPSVFGQSVTFTATVSPVAPGAGTPTGTVTFLDGGSPIGTGTLSGGIATFTTSALAVGNHTITTNFGGDGNFNGSTGSLAGNPQIVNKADTSSTVTSSLNPSVFGQSVTFTATVSAVAPGAGTPVGTVTFLDSGSPIGTGTLSGGIATFTTSALAGGNHTITTSYGGDGNFNGSTGSLTGNPQVVNKADTSTTVTSSTNPSVFGQSVTFTATVAAVAPGSGTPTGTVTFLDGGSPIGTGTLSGGIATFTTSALAVGNHTITSSYGADGNFNGSTGSLTGNPQVVNKTNTATAVTSSVNPAVFGQSVTFTATISPVAPGSGTPTGTVTFLDGGSPIGTGTLSGGIATFTASALAVGNHTITTSYGGDGNFNGSTGSLTGNPQVVNKANTATAVTSSTNPSVFGQSVTFTATVSPVAPGSGTPTGTVTFLDGGSPISTGTLSGGIATFTTSALAVGNHTITTSYGADGNFNGSTGSLTGNPQVVNKANTTTAVISSQNPAIAGQPVTFTATVSPLAPGAGTPTGTVTFLDGGSPIGTGTLSGGIATFTTSALAIGNHTITTNYGGDGNFNSNTGSLNTNPQVINKTGTTTAVTSSQNSSALGQAVTFTATVTVVPPGAGTPTGTVTFLDGGSPMGTGTMSGGVATFTTSSLAAGNHNITTSYPGDTSFNGSTGSLTGNPQVVVAPPSIAKAFNPAVIAVNGVSTLTLTITNPGADTVAEAGVAFTDNLPAGLVVATPNGLGNTCGGTATATAGSGSVSLTGGSVPVASSCTVSVNVTSSAAGNYNNTTGAVSSTNGGTGNTASASLSVQPADLTITKTHTDPFSRGQTGATYTITVKNSGAGPTLGTVMVVDTLPNVSNTFVATAMSGTGWSCTLGTLTCTRSDALTPGASYPAITLTVNVPANIKANVTNTATVSGGGESNTGNDTANDPTHIGAAIQITPANGTATITAGQPANFGLTLDSTPGMGTVNFSCSGLPAASTCTFNPPSSSQLTDTVNMNIATTARSASSLPMGPGGPTYALLFSSLGLAGIVIAGTNSKKVRLRVVMAVSGIVLLLALAGCGGRPQQTGTNGTPAGTYTITVTGTSGAASGSATVTLSVQ
ncbi:MAG TPA: Ig-like domain repeat protein [Candidatus Angelobacter sp.]|nr:Ig-like domain repeat protein [Candidatus Angelobacter sp.]